MTLKTMTGFGFLWPGNPAMLNQGSGTTSSVIDAAGEQFANCGRVWWADRADTEKVISKVHFRTGTVSGFGGTSAQWRLSLQDVSTSVGPIMQPVGVVDQSFTSEAATGPTSSAWNTVTLSSTRTVNFGDLLAVVIDYAVFDGSAVINIVYPANLTTGGRNNHGVAGLYTGSWAEVSGLMNFLLEFDDGTFGMLFGSLPYTTFNTRTFNVDTTDPGSGATLTRGDERGLQFVPEVPMAVDGMWFLCNVTSGGDFSVVLYEGSTAMTGGTVAVDANAVGQTSTLRWMYIPFGGALTLSTANTYRLVLKPTTTNNATLHTLTLGAAGYRTVYGGTNIAGNARVDGGAWLTADTTEIPIMMLSVSAVDDGAGGGGLAQLVGPGGLVQLHV
jgi:hypothetical protein